LDKDDEGQALCADSVFKGEKQKEVIAKYKMMGQAHEKRHNLGKLTEKIGALPKLVVFVCSLSKLI